MRRISEPFQYYQHYQKFTKKSFLNNYLMIQKERQFTIQRNQASEKDTQLKLRDDIQKTLNKNEIKMSVFIDYSKVFDRIQHEALIKKLANLNFSNSSIKIIIATEVIDNSMCNQMIKNPHINLYNLGFHRAVSLAPFYLIYMFHNYHHV